MDKKSWNLITDCMDFLYHDIGDKAKLISKLEERKQEIKQNNRAMFELLDGIIINIRHHRVSEEE